MHAHPHHSGPAVAVVGMSCRFPGSPDVRAFWANLLAGKSSITFFSPEELIQAGYDAEQIASPDFVPSLGGILEDKDKFDNYFFGMTPNEAQLMDPQMRIFLQEAWHALEDAAYPFNSASRPITGIFAGATNSVLWQARALLSGKVGDLGIFQTQMLINKDLLAVKTAHLLDCKGPAYSVNTACSTSLVAVHLACQSLLRAECELALAGGISMSYYKVGGVVHRAGSIASANGMVKAFDNAADGITGSEGVGIVTLKRLDDALRDHDRIYAIIRSSAINNDGRQKAGFSAPSVQGQSQVIRQARELAGISPDQLCYVETHGSGTPIGDLTEIEAMTNAFGTTKKGYCGIGSVKTNIGHPDVAAGVAGLIKTILAIHHRIIPPSLNFEVPNLQVDWLNSPFYLVDSPTKLPDENPVFAGVNSFGVGGTNAHVIVENAPPLTNRIRRKKTAEPPFLIVLSAATASGFNHTIAAIADHLSTHPDITPAALAYTLQVGRKAFRYRHAFFASTLEECIEGLRAAGLTSPPVHVPEDPVMTWRLEEGCPAQLSEHQLYLRYNGFRELARQIRSAFSDIIKKEYAFLHHQEKEKIWEDLLPVLNVITEAAFLSRLTRVPQSLETAGRTLLFAPWLAGALDLRGSLSIILGLMISRLSTYANQKSLVRKIHSLKPLPLQSLILFGPGEKPLQPSAIATFDFWDQAIQNDHRLSSAHGEDWIAVTLGTASNRMIENLPALLQSLWNSGITIDWQQVHAGTDMRPVTLPGYVFDPHPFWLEDRPLSIPEEQTPSTREDPEKWYYYPSWERSARVEADTPGQTKETILLFVTDDASPWIIPPNGNQEFVRIRKGDRFAYHAPCEFALDPAREDQFITLFRTLQSEDRLPSRIIYAWDIHKSRSPLRLEEDTLTNGFFGLVYLSRALAAMSFDSPVTLKLLTANLCQVTGGERISPLQGLSAGLLMVLRQEYPFLKCMQLDIDIDEYPDPGSATRELLDSTTEPCVAIRNRLRWRLNYHQLPLTPVTGQPAWIKEKGVYIVIGGLGLIGGMLCRYLARSAGARLVILGRTALPADWNQPDEKANSNGISKRIRTIRELQSLGSEVIYRQIDITDTDDWRRLLTEVYTRWGMPDGIFHAAGEIDKRILRTPVMDIGRADSDTQFSPKVRAVLAMFEAIKEYPPGFVVLTSSLASVVGGLGLGSYTAANKFMDAFVRFAAVQMPATRWIAVNTAEWLTHDEMLLPDNQQTTAFMSPDEGLDTFQRILGHEVPEQVVISTVGLQQRISRWVNMDEPDRKKQAAQPNAEFARPDIGTPFAAPVTREHQEMAAVWSRLLGYREIGIDDNFFQLGGDSLKVIMAVSHLHQALSIQIPIATFYTMPTIRLLSAWAQHAPMKLFAFEASGGVGDAALDALVTDGK